MDAQVRDSPRLSPDASQLFPRRRIPELDPIAGRGQHIAFRGEGQTKDAVVETPEARALGGRRNVPKSHGVLVPRGQSISVRRKRHSQHVVLVPSERRRLIRLEIPQLYMFPVAKGQ